jgi:hypothetical protein
VGHGILQALLLLLLLMMMMMMMARHKLPAGTCQHICHSYVTVNT